MAPWLPGAFAGVDCEDPKPEGWLKNLLLLSNFSFTLHYLAHNPYGLKNDDITNTKPAPEPWKAVFPALLKQGWGFGFTFLALSQRRNSPWSLSKPPDLISWERYPSLRFAPNNPSTRDPHKPTDMSWLIPWPKNREELMEAAETAGVEHAQKLKQYAIALGHEAQGAIVYLDCEDVPTKPHEDLRPEVVRYYNMLFQILRDPGTDNVALRPAMHARLRPLMKVIPSTIANTDLFAVYCDDNWDYDAQDKAKDLYVKAGRVYSPIERHPLRALAFEDYQNSPTDHETEIDNSNKPIRTLMLLARQWRLAEESQIPPTGLGPKGLLPGQTGWDWNVAMVRDLRYPIAVPRIAVTDEVYIRSVFSIPLVGVGGSRLPNTRLEQVYSGDPIKLPFTETNSEMLEHEAPILLLPAASKELRNKTPSEDRSGSIVGKDTEIITLNMDGDIVLITGSSDNNAGGTVTWSRPVPILSGSQPLLRRNRAMAAIKSSGKESTETQAFFVSSNHQLMVTRRTPTSRWTDPVTLAGGLIVHPFSNIAACTRQVPQDDDKIIDMVDVFFLNIDSRLCVTTLSTNAKSWPEQGWTPLQDKTTLLSGTSISAVAPFPNEVVVFAIGIDCRLYMSGYRKGVGWPTNMTEVKGPGLPKTADRLFPHSKMDAYVYATSKYSKQICVAAVTAVNVPCVYMFKNSLDGWKLTQGSPLYLHMDPNLKIEVRPESKVEAAPGLPEDYNDKIIQDRVGSGQEKRRKLTTAYAVNPFGDVRLSMIGAELTLWAAGVTMLETPGLPGDRVVMMYFKNLLQKEKVSWNMVKRAK